jgi:hypothetical protein
MAYIFGTEHKTPIRAALHRRNWLPGGAGCEDGRGDVAPVSGSLETSCEGEQGVRGGMVRRRASRSACGSRVSPPDGAEWNIPASSRGGMHHIFRVLFHRRQKERTFRDNTCLSCGHPRRGMTVASAERRTPIR